MEWQVRNEDVGVFAPGQLLYLILLEPLERAIDPIRNELTVLERFRLAVDINKDEPVIFRRLFERLVQMRNESRQYITIISPILVCSSEQALDSAHLRFNPIALTSLLGHRGKLAVFRLAVGLVLQRKIKTCADKDVGNHQLMVRTLKLLGIL